MPKKRRVTDILDLMGPVAFVMHPYYIEGVCPWCAGSIGDIDKSPQMTIGEMYSKLYDQQAPHMDTCSGREATEMVVETEDRRPLKQ